MLEIDRWILSRAEELIRRSRAWYDELAFHKVYRAVYDFATADLSSVYFDVLKDRLYTAATRSRARRSGQTALYRIHYALVRLLAPLLSFTAEEVWGYTAKPAGAPDSVHLALLPEPEEASGGLDARGMEKWERLLGVREDVLKTLEEARQAKVIGSPLEARVRLQGYDLPEGAADLPSLFIVSQVAVEPGDEPRVIGGTRGRDQVRALLEVLDRCGSRTRIFQPFAIPARRRSGKCWDECAGAIGCHRSRGGGARSCYENIYPLAFHGLGRSSGHFRIFQHRPYGKSRRGVWGSGRFRQPVAQSFVGRRIARGDGDHRHITLAACTDGRFNLAHDKPVWRWFSAAHWEMSGTALCAARSRTSSSFTSAPMNFRRSMSPTVRSPSARRCCCWIYGGLVTISAINRQRYTHRRCRRALVGLLLIAGPLLAQGISPSEYRARRAELRKSLDGVMVLFGAREPEDLHSRFFQETNFLYLSGWREPGAIMMLTAAEEILFLPPRDPVEEKYSGPKTGFDDPERCRKNPGLTKYFRPIALETNFLRALESSR